MAHNTMPWQSEASKGDKARDKFKYKYHPGGDPTKPAKEAPSALNSVVVPNVTLPKVSGTVFLDGDVGLLGAWLMESAV